jgi:hypothetical protein
LICYTNMYS